MSDITPPPPPPPLPPPPPPPPGDRAPTPGPSGGQLDAGAAIGYGWNGLTKNLGPLVLITLVIVAIQIGFSIFGRAFDGLILQLTWNIATTVVGLILAMGLIRAALAVVDGRTPEVGMLFQPEGFVPYLVASILVGLAVGVGLIFCIIPGLILAFLFAFYGYGIVDGRAEDGIESMKMSWNLVSSNVGALLLLFVLVILINLGGALLCGIGLLFTYPLTAIAVAYAWRTLTGGTVAQLA
ncbi:MAG: hypothetical protein LH645_11110 [Actinomycetia bacterium]|nr:hypothetical protein [Actinomycetes bacterium]